MIYRGMQNLENMRWTYLWSSKVTRDSFPVPRSLKKVENGVQGEQTTKKEDFFVSLFHLIRKVIYYWEKVLTHMQCICVSVWEYICVWECMIVCEYVCIWMCVCYFPRMLWKYTSIKVKRITYTKTSLYFFNYKVRIIKFFPYFLFSTHQVKAGNADPCKVPRSFEKAKIVLRVLRIMKRCPFTVN